MKLCPLFESLCGWRCHTPTLEHVQLALPREAIEEAIDALEYRRLGYVGYPKVQVFDTAIEQLRAMLPEGRE